MCTLWPKNDLLQRVHSSARQKMPVKCCNLHHDVSDAGTAKHVETMTSTSGRPNLSLCLWTPMTVLLANFSGKATIDFKARQLRNLQHSRLRGWYEP
jgi:hypothetical protein